MRVLNASAAALMAALGWGAQATPVHAQDNGNWDRDRNVSVRGRPRPEYDAVGIPMGSYRLYPELDVSAEYNDNIFATNTGEQSDTIFHVDAKADLRSQWANHELDFSLEVPSDIYSSFDRNNTTDAIGDVKGRLDVYRDFNLHGELSYADAHESLASDPSILPLAEPVHYTFGHANAGFVKAFNRIRVSGEADWTSYNYDDGRLFNNLPFNEDDRDRDVMQVGGRIDYAMSPMTAFFVSVSGNQRDYRLDPPDVTVNRDSQGYEALAGGNFDLTHLIRGEVGLGYLHQSYDDPTVGDTSGVAVRANVEWFPDELVTVTFGAAREVDDAGANGAASYIANNASFAIDYEWRRNIIFGVQADYSEDDYRGIDRTDNRWDARFKADYLVNRGVSLFFDAGHYEQTSDGVQQGREYAIDRALIGIRLRR